MLPLARRSLHASNCPLRGVHCTALLALMQCTVAYTARCMVHGCVHCTVQHTAHVARCGTHCTLCGVLHMFQPPFSPPLTSRQFPCTQAPAARGSALAQELQQRQKGEKNPRGRQLEELQTPLRAGTGLLSVLWAAFSPCWLLSSVGWLPPRTPGPPFAPKTQGRRGGRSWRRSRPVLYSWQSKAAPSKQQGTGTALPWASRCRAATSLAALQDAHGLPHGGQDHAIQLQGRTGGGLSTTQPPRGPPSRVPKRHPPEPRASARPPGDRCRGPRSGQRSPGTGTAAPR